MKHDVKLSPPWATYYHYIDSLFKGDKDVEVVYAEQDYLIEVNVSDETKASALKIILPSKKEFGNVVLNIEVNYVRRKEGEGEESTDIIDVFKMAFQGNPNVNDIVSVKDFFGNTVNFVLFKKEVIQFFNDDISDAHGVESTLNEDIARDVFTKYAGKVLFCTDTEDK